MTSPPLNATAASLNGACPHSAAAGLAWIIAARFPGGARVSDLAGVFAPRFRVHRDHIEIALNSGVSGGLLWREGVSGRFFAHGVPDA